MYALLVRKKIASLVANIPVRFISTSLFPTFLSACVTEKARRYFSHDRSFLVVNAVGLDRPGIVSEMTKVVTDADGNVGESRALRLGEHFTLMMLCSVPGTNEEKIQKMFGELEDLHITTFKTRDPASLEVTPKIGCKCRYNKQMYPCNSVAAGTLCFGRLPHLPPYNCLPTLLAY